MSRPAQRIGSFWGALLERLGGRAQYTGRPRGNTFRKVRARGCAGILQRICKVELPKSTLPPLILKRGPIQFAALATWGLHGYNEAGGDLSALADFVNFHAAVILPDCTIVLNAISTPKPPGTLAISMPFRFLPSCDFWTVVFLLARVGLVAFIDPAGCFAHLLRLSHIRFGILQHQTFLLTKPHLYPQLLFARSENMAFAFHTSTDTAATMRACICYLIAQAIQ